ncbi:argininosuccinate synthase [Pleionea sp. CnH1-48]|uniref:argininosuccinate synthase n=1 Tax=Pleionea sp. CnH1-48 TaxID=2954494 RepID=UPI002096A018|nr:argininosuccinate synthase [Pleionea sp. CnH1-48]MCO7224450.1 argininosuccinate synthase [Pleionea sp. CnH1-48]
MNTCQSIMPTKKVVLAYSGGLDTSTIIPWLKENYHCEVIAFVADVGQGDDELKGIEEKALSSGASECHIFDLKEAFVSDYIYPTLVTGAIYEDEYLLGTAMARPIIAKAQVELALSIGADALAHGCTGKGNDQVRFEAVYATLAPQLKVIAPWREWGLTSREDCLEYLEQRGISCSASAEKIYSRDANAWHISHEGGELEHTWTAATQKIWTWTAPLEDTPSQPETLTIDINHGNIVAINGQQKSPLECLDELNLKAAQHGVGRIDIVENRLVGMKSRGCYETPGGTVMYKALRALEQLVYDRDAYHFRQSLALEFAQLVYDGKWFSAKAQSILSACKSLANDLSGKVVVELFRGQAKVIQKQSANSLYSEDFATFGQDDVYRQTHAEGFIRLFALSGRIKALKKQGVLQ